MAPLAIAQIAEDLSYSPSSVLSTEECFTRAVTAGSGAFCVGFSAGVAVQVHYGRFLPKSLKAMLILPTLVGAGCASMMYRHSTDRCLQQWTAFPHQYNTHHTE